MKGSPLQCSLQPRRGSYHPGDAVVVDVQVSSSPEGHTPPPHSGAPFVPHPPVPKCIPHEVVRSQVASHDSGANAPLELTDLLIELKCIERTDQSWVSIAWGADAGPPLQREGRRVSRQLLHAAARYSAQPLNLVGSPQCFVFR